MYKITNCVNYTLIMGEFYCMSNITHKAVPEQTIICSLNKFSSIYTGAANFQIYIYIIELL